MFTFVKFCYICFEVFWKILTENMKSRKIEEHYLFYFFSRGPQNLTYGALLTSKFGDERYGGKIFCKTLLIQWKKNWAKGAKKILLCL